MQRRQGLQIPKPLPAIATIIRRFAFWSDSVVLKKSRRYKPNDLPFPCELFIPDTFPDGRPVESVLLRPIKTTIVRRFGGLTDFGLADGLWYDEVERRICCEKMRRLRVAVKLNDLPLLEQTANEIGRATSQKVMYYEVNRDTQAQFLAVKYDMHELPHFDEAADRKNAIATHSAD